METLEQVLKYWETDSVIDETEPSREIIRIPNLHSKYLNIMTKHKIAVKKATFDYHRMKKVKWEYYTGKMDEDELQQYGWEPFRFTLKSDVSTYLESDSDLIKLLEKKVYHEEVVEVCTAVLKELANRTWQLREHMTHERFIQEQDNLVIAKKNEVYAHIECEKHLAKELSEYFTFYVPGYQFTPAFRNRIWDGKIRLFDQRNSNIYLGLLPYIEQFASERQYDIEYGEPRPDLTDDFSVYLANKFIEELNLQAHGNSIEVRDYQLNAFVHGMRHHRALLLSPTASGKSLIIYLFIRQFIDYKGYKGLIIVPTTSLVEQLYTDFIDYSSANGFDIEANVHRVYQGKDKISEKNLIISTWQSLYKLPKEYFEQFDYIIGDEAHLFKAQSLTTIMTSCINTKYRIGLTGTLDGTKTHKLVLEGLFGPVEKVTTTKKLIENEQLAEFDIKCLILKHPEEIAKELKKKEYKDEIEYLIGCEARNKFIKNLALSLGNNTLILYQYVDKHGQLLYDWITNAKNIGNRKVFFIHGGVDAEEREQVRRIMEEENDAIVVASFGTFSTGINIRNLHNIIFASPSKSRIRNLQSIGRGLRKGETKDKATLFDIADHLRVGKHMNFTLRHFVERTKIYNDEGFPYKLYKIGLKNGTN